MCELCLTTSVGIMQNCTFTKRKQTISTIKIFLLFFLKGKKKSFYYASIHTHGVKSFAIFIQVMLFSVKHVPKQKLYKHVYTPSISEIICHFYVASVMLFFKHVPQKGSYMITSYIRWKTTRHFYKINNAIFSNMYQNKRHYFPSWAVH